MSLCRKQPGFHVYCWVHASPVGTGAYLIQLLWNTRCQPYATRFIGLTNSVTPEPELPRLPCITPVSRFIVWGFACWIDSMEGKTASLHWSYYRSSSQGEVNVHRSQAASLSMTGLPSALFWHAQETRLAALNTGGLSLHAVNSEMRGWLKVSNLPNPSLTFDLWASRQPTMTPHRSASDTLGVTAICRIFM